MLKKLRLAVSNFIAPEKNAMTLPQQFLRNGIRGDRIFPDWTQVVMSDEDLYTGYSYAAIRNRANSVAQLAIERVKTESEKKEEVTHPYLDVIRMSPTFSDHQFWYTISTYLDLEGFFPLMTLRNLQGRRYGKVQEFKLLNPYNIKRIIDQETGEIGGYEEWRSGLVRKIPPEMVIEIRTLNPFNQDEPFALTDAVKENQFNIKTAGDFTRHALKNNINAPGVMSTDVILPPEQFKNFTERVKTHAKGEPIFANGKGAVSWESMQLELEHASLDKIQEIELNTLLAVTGMSKTMLGIEQSGVTRETSKTQRDINIENQILPQIQLIIDALNQDYKNKYPEEYEASEPVIVVDNPLASDHDAEIKQTEVQLKKAELYMALINKGYDEDIAAQYADGKIDLEKLGKPTNPPVTIALPVDTSEDNAWQFNSVETQSGLVAQQEGSLRNSIINIEQELVARVLERVTRKIKNAPDFSSVLDIISKRDQNMLVGELEFVLSGFYGIMMSLKGGETMRDRIGTFSLLGSFSLDRKVKSYIKNTSSKVAESHVNTVLNDLLEQVRKTALEGEAGLDEITRAIRKEYSQSISKNRAKTIARTETNRAFTRAQFEADRQFVEQNKLEGRVFKKWTTRSDNPCDFCQSLAKESPIPFSQDFRGLGDTVEVGGKSLTVGFEALEAGNAHPNCSCIYELIIEKEN